eukprot:5781246-Pyramimonas_sp.AAC.2
MSKVVPSKQQHRALAVDRVAAMRVCFPAAANRAAVVKEDGLLEKADAQANPESIGSPVH